MINEIKLHDLLSCPIFFLIISYKLFNHLKDKIEQVTLYKLSKNVDSHKSKTYFS